MKSQSWSRNFSKEKEVLFEDNKRLRERSEILQKFVKMANARLDGSTKHVFLAMKEYYILVPS